MSINPFFDEKASDYQVSYSHPGLSRSQLKLGMLGQRSENGEELALSPDHRGNRTSGGPN